MKLNALNRMGFIGQHTKLGDVLAKSITDIKLKADASGNIIGGTIIRASGKTENITIETEK